MRILFFILGYIAGIFFVLIGGFLESFGLFLEMTAGFALVCLLRNFVWRKVFHKSIQSWKQIVGEFVVFAIVFQVFLILIVPRSSFVPDILLERSGITDFLEGSVCDTEGYLRMLKSFWGANIDFDKVRIVQGGMMANLAFLNKLGMIKDGHVRSAITFGNTIYLGNITPCPTGELYFHEMTHVWQTQTQQSHLFGLKSVSGWIRLHYAQVVNPDPLYNYGGYYGLLAAKNQNKKFLDFNIEEQAMIVEHWYWIIKKGYVLPEGEVLTEKYAKLLEYYVSDMLQNKE